jgi:hypothetical protein
MALYLVRELRRRELAGTQLFHEQRIFVQPCAGGIRRIPPGN